MHLKSHQKRSGFTLVEIMIVVAIIALLAAIALPSFLRARKRSQATSVLNDLRLLDAALDQYAADNGKPNGYVAQFGDLQNYLKTDTTLYSSGGVDIVGDTYGPFAVDSIPQVPDNTFNQYSDVADAGFWGQFYGSGSNAAASGGSSNPYAGYTTNNPMNESQYGEAARPIFDLQNVLQAGGTPTPNQIAAAQLANQQLNAVSAQGGLGLGTSPYAGMVSRVNLFAGTSLLTAPAP